MDTETIQDSKENIPNIKFISDNLLASTKPRTINKPLVPSNAYLTPNYSTTSTKMILEKNLHSIFMEHCYSRPHTWRPETHFLRPTKTIFMPAKFVAPIKCRRRSYNSGQEDDNNDALDVVSVDTQKLNNSYDVHKANFLMDECERHARFARVDEGDDAWEDHVSKSGWTANQNRLFDKVVEILDAEYTSRLAYKGAYNEPVIRRALIEKTVKRYRWLMSTVSWDLKLSQWLHQILTDYTSTHYLAIYLDMLQTLKSKLPSFTDRLMFGPNQLNRVGVTSTESLFPLLKRRWDPFSAQTQPTTSLSGTPPKHSSDSNGPSGVPKRLPGNAVIVVVPGGPTTTSSGKRLAKWITLLNQLAPAYPVFANIGTGGSRMTILSCLEQMFASTRAKVQEVKADHPNRNLILVGIQGAGAALALQVAQVENVLCCVCIGFGVHTADGRRGQPDDQMMELQSPVLFVVGQCATTARQEEMEDLRERMRVETGLLMVGGADDYLRLSKKKRRGEGVTQCFVDRCIVEEIGNFASDILLSPYPPQMRQSPTHQSNAAGSSSTAAAAATAAVRNFATAHLDHNRRNRNNSNGSSLDSEPPSPLPHVQHHQQTGQQKTTRPGRPPGSTAKARHTNPSNLSHATKWATFNPQQGTQSTSSNLHTPTQSTPTPTSSSSIASSAPPPAYPDFPPHQTQPTITRTTPSKQPVAQQQHATVNKTFTAEDSPLKLTGSGRLTTPEKQKGGASGGGGGGVKSPSVSAKLQALATRGVISHNIVNTPSGIRTIPPKTSNIKVLNNITIANPTLTNTTTNLTKQISTTQSTAGQLAPPSYNQRPPKTPLTNLTGGTTFGSLVLLPDGKLARSCGTSSSSSSSSTVPQTTTSSVVKGLGSTPIMFPLNATSSNASPNVAFGAASSAPTIHYSCAITVPPPSKVLNVSAGSCVTAVNRMRPKYITSKTQLITNRVTGQKQIKTIPYIQTTQTTTLNATLPPPTNLTSQEIMDLPIIFADDDNATNQMLQNNTTKSQTIQTNQLLTIPSTSSSKPQGKLVIVNKPGLTFSSHNILKRPAAQTLQKSAQGSGVSGVKYTKIILSKCPPTILNDEQKNNQSPIGTSLQLPTDLSIRKESTTKNIKLEEPFDLEKELIATAVVKPSCCNVDPKRMTFIYKGDSNAEVQEHISTCTNAEIKKMLEAKEEM